MTLTNIQSDRADFETAGRWASSSTEATHSSPFINRIWSTTTTSVSAEGFTGCSSQRGQSFPKAREWGGCRRSHRAACVLSTTSKREDDVDHTRVAIMGHSKMGKATLWTAAQDQRFAMAISAQSGCAGGLVAKKVWRNAGEDGYPFSVLALPERLEVCRARKTTCRSTNTCYWP